MPTYEYECRACAHTFEAFQAMSDDPLSRCPSCGSSVRRIINGGELDRGPFAVQVTLHARKSIKR